MLSLAVLFSTSLKSGDSLIGVALPLACSMVIHSQGLAAMSICTSPLERKPAQTCRPQ